MTPEEKNSISAGLLIFATATEMMMREWLGMENAVLTGESKMLFNGMKNGIASAKHYYERFTDKVATVLFSDDNNLDRFDSMRRSAATLIRIYLKILNLNYNEVNDEDVEKVINDMLKDKPDTYVGQSVIDKFQIK